MFGKRIYDYFVVKNEKIKFEYQGYTEVNKERHRKHRIDSWFLLLRLNFYYRIFRRKGPLIKPGSRFYTSAHDSFATVFANNVIANVNNEVIEKSQDVQEESKTITVDSKKLLEINEKNTISEAEARVNKWSESRSAVNRYYLLQQLALKVRNYDVISFDVFDTLIFRPFADPKALFLLLGHELGIYNFYDFRIKAEREARDKQFINHGNREVTLLDIYKIIEKQIGLKAEVGAKAEFDMECKYCYANPYFKAVYRMLSGMGKYLVVTSDMYLSKEQIKYILEKNGYKNLQNIIVSCEYNTSKASGGLYDYLKNIYKHKKIVHIGDNYQSDFIIPQKKGIDSIHYPNINLIQDSKRAPGMSFLLKELYGGLVNNLMLNRYKVYDTRYEFGYIYGGLYVLGFANWINQTAKRDGVEKILFLSRDGDIYSRVFDMLDDHLPWEYFLWSRIVGMKMSTTYDIYEFVIRMVYHKAGSVNPPAIGRLLESLRLDCLKKYLKQYKLNEDLPVNHDNKKMVADLFLEHKDEIVEAYKEERETTFAVIRKAIGNYKKIAIVDVGWAGSGPLGIKYLIQKEMGLDVEVECYLAASHHFIQPLPASYIMSGEIKTYLFSQMENRINYDAHANRNKTMDNLLFEIFTQACSPTFIGYMDNKVNYDTPECENFETIRTIHKGILDFAKQYLSTFGDRQYLLNISGYDAYLPFRHITNNIPYIKDVFATLSMSRGVLSDTENQRIETLDELFNQVGL